MSSNRRVRFAEDSDKSQSSPRPEIIENPLEENVALEMSLRAQNVRSAEQRAHDAVMLARAMQADIQSSNAKLQRFGQGLKSGDGSLSHTEPAAAQTTSTDNQVGQLLNILNDQDIVAAPMGRITNAFLLNK